MIPEQKELSFVCIYLIFTILAGIKTSKRRPKNLHKVAHASQVLVHVPEVSVDVVSIPGKNTAIIHNTQAKSGISFK